MRREILLSYFPKITPKRYHDLVAVFDNLDRAWQCGFDDYKKIGWEDELISEFLKWRGTVDEEKIEKILKQEKIYCLTEDDVNYPPLLKEIYDPPFCLFVRGELKPSEFMLAVVGPRKFSSYGKQIAEELTRDLAGQGITIVSGLALGIDSIAHQAALDASGITIAVLGTGINRAHIYPAAHKQLAEKIIENNGAVISEYPPGTLPTKFTFPRRNRIIAGMSLGTLVIEATDDSGALITAQCALDYNREVFAVPQNITSLTASGVNALIKNGAHPVTSAQDIFDALNLRDVKQFVANREIIPDSPAEAEIIKHLAREPIHVDQLVKLSGLDSPAVNSTLVLMEMKGKVRNLGGMMYVLSK
ncbi:MAG: DNA-protecting protein DprA [Candidatus Magasanikbacteria bacterium]|nr:DNA-protecting protein DprA [Candidatus Magasanikbacteria bacterium]